MTLGNVLQDHVEGGEGEGELGLLAAGGEVEADVEGGGEAGTERRRGRTEEEVVGRMETKGSREECKQLVQIIENKMKQKAKMKTKNIDNLNN